MSNTTHGSTMTPKERKHACKVLQALIDTHWGGNRAQFARDLGVTPQAASSWFRTGSFPPERMPLLCYRADESGQGIDPAEIRPDVFGKYDPSRYLPWTS